jgi:AAA+ superfamily predicted ATPase
MNPIADKIRAGYAGLFLVSHEEQRAERMMLDIIREVNEKRDPEKTPEYKLIAWSCIDGAARVELDGLYQIDNTGAPEEILTSIAQGADANDPIPAGSVILLRDFHHYLREHYESKLTVWRLLKNALAHAWSTNKCLVILAPELVLPTDFSKLFSVVDFTLPTPAEMEAMISLLCENNGHKKPGKEKMEALVDAAAGLTLLEAEDAASLSIAETGKLDPTVIFREKCAQLKKTGLIEIVESKLTLADIGGLEPFKEHLQGQRQLFRRAAREFGLDTPRSELIVGQGGTGKSLTAEAAGNIYNQPLMRVRAGSIMDSLVGGSEKNWRTIWATAKAIGGILWVDEAEALFGGSGNDGNTSRRVEKEILQSTSERSNVMLFFTANDIDHFPDPLIDRCNVWSVDLPHEEERRQIWTIHIQKRKRSADKFDVPMLAKQSEGYSGRQIEQVWLKAMTNAFNDGQREPTTADIMAALKLFKPTSVTMKEKIEARRKRLEGRATPASAPMVVAGKVVNGARKIAA